MKKITAFFVSLVMVMTTLCVSAADISRSAELSEVLYGDTVQIVYNGSLMEQGDVEPQNIDGRVMIPFRNVLENLGAEIEYSEADKKVTATKGDTKINFTLMDDTIYIDNNGEKSEITMDVPMVVKNDRTLVPVRFMSNALGMEVGWDSYANAVVIVDKAELIEEFGKIAPNLSKMLNMEQVAYNQEDGTLQLKVEGKGEDFNLLVDLNAKISATMAGDAYGMNLTFDFKLNGGGETVDIKDGTLDIVLSQGKLYLKTDAIKKAADSINSPELNEVAAVVLADTWYSVDLNQLVDVMFAAGNEKELFKKIINLDFAAEDLNTDISELVTIDEIMLSDAEFLATYLDVFERIDKYIVVTEGEDGAYSTSIKFTIKDIFDMANSMVHEVQRVPEADLAEIYEMITMTIEAVTEADKTSAKSTGLIDVAINIEGESIIFKMNFENNAKLLEKTEDVMVPDESIDVTEMLIGSGETV